jgi:hypothetical protein
MSIIAVRRRRRVQTVLLLIGSSALVARVLFWDVFMCFLGYYKLVHEDSAFAAVF